MLSECHRSGFRLTYHGFLLAIGVVVASCTDQSPSPAPDAGTSVGSGGATCGDGICAASETPSTCPQDCHAASECGDGICAASETPSTCPQDCHAVSQCGNGICDANETPSTCPQDCPTSVCGNGTCDAGETASSCAQDCSATLVIDNLYSSPINTLFVFSCNSTVTGPNQLSSGETIPTGTTFSLRGIPPDCYLFEVVATDGASAHTPTGINLTDGETYTWTITN